MLHSLEEKNTVSHMAEEQMKENPFSKSTHQSTALMISTSSIRPYCPELPL
jgi:hypothetical protein